MKSLIQRLAMGADRHRGDLGSDCCPEGFSTVTAKGHPVFRRRRDARYACGAWVVAILTARTPAGDSVNRQFSH
jgi:hypothetical protein